LDLLQGGLFQGQTELFGKLEAIILGGDRLKAVAAAGGGLGVATLNWVPNRPSIARDAAAGYLRSGVTHWTGSWRVEPGRRAAHPGGW